MRRSPTKLELPANQQSPNPRKCWKIKDFPIFRARYSNVYLKGSKFHSFRAQTWQSLHRPQEHSENIEEYHVDVKFDGGADGGHQIVRSGLYPPINCRLRFQYPQFHGKWKFHGVFRCRILLWIRWWWAKLLKFRYSLRIIEFLPEKRDFFAIIWFHRVFSSLFSRKKWFGGNKWSHFQ